MKKLRYVRHSLKDGAIIGAEGLAYAQGKAPAGDYTDLFYGPLYRTLQTVLAVIAAIGCQPGTKVHMPIAEIGSDELFKVMANDAFKAAVKAGKTNIEAVYEAGHSSDQLEIWTADAANGVKKMLDEMPDGSFGIALGHDPVIPMAAQAFDCPVPSLKEMEYVDFIQYTDGTIVVEDPRK
jgi:hypothetical protein